MHEDGRRVAMLKRAYLQGSPKAIFQSIDEHVIIQMWPVSGIEQMKQGSQIYINKNAQQCDQAHGIPISMNPIEIEVLPGETLWAISEDVGLLGMSIKFLSKGSRRRV
jgi:hypothetical protein